MSRRITFIDLTDCEENSVNQSETNQDVIVISDSDEEEKVDPTKSNRKKKSPFALLNWSITNGKRSAFNKSLEEIERDYPGYLSSPEGMGTCKRIVDSMDSDLAYSASYHWNGALNLMKILNSEKEEEFGFMYEQVRSGFRVSKYEFLKNAKSFIDAMKFIKNGSQNNWVTKRLANRIKEQSKGLYRKVKFKIDSSKKMMDESLEDFEDFFSEQI